MSLVEPRKRKLSTMHGFIEYRSHKMTILLLASHSLYLGFDFYGALIYTLMYLILDFLHREASRFCSNHIVRLLSGDVAIFRDELGSFVIVLVEEFEVG